VLSFDALLIGRRIRGTESTREQRGLPKARFGGASGHVSRSDEAKSYFSGAGLSVWIWERVGATILQRGDEAIFSSFGPAGRVSSSTGRVEKHESARRSATLPDLVAILDATNWEQLKPENFLENRLSYSAFKHMNVYQVLLGE
jgi:hypothetical protein